VCHDGQSLVVFDNSGVGSNASTDPWVMDFKPAVQPSGVQWEIGHYKVQGKTIYGIVCRPITPGKHKTVIINHGGFELNEIALNNFCIPSAAGGWVVAMSAYRGEKIKHSTPLVAPGQPVPPDQPIFSGASLYKSQGEIELCLGEVTDVMRITEIVRSWPSVDTDRVLMWGHSHGACVTVRALQRGVKVKAAAAFAAPTDMAAWYGYSPPSTPTDTEFTNNRLALATTFGDITTTPRTRVTPDQSRIPYDWRSPVTYAEDLKARTDVKILLLQGAADLQIHPSQACALARAYAPSNSPEGTASMNWHLGASGAAVGGSPFDCAGITGLTWTGGLPPRGTWPHSRYLLVYDNLDHDAMVFGPSGLPLTSAAGVDFLNWVGVIFP
jgi:dienelactone hydrolase